MASTISTRFLIISDTHGDDIPIPFSDDIDVLIHCGDLTEESKLAEYQTTLNLLKQITAPLKLIIPGNHDFTLDDAVFKKKVLEAQTTQNIDDDSIVREYGRTGDTKALCQSQEAKDAGIVFLDEGTHHFTLANGARLTVFASPYTPGVSDWGFQYSLHEGHEWDIRPGVDIVVTHGPPRGVLDYTNAKQRAGCPQLFEAVAGARPLMHCFGHVHEGWGAKRVAWRRKADDLQLGRGRRLWRRFLAYRSGGGIRRV